jgi:hypothetical protein
MGVVDFIYSAQILDESRKFFEATAVSVSVRDWDI